MSSSQPPPSPPPPPSSSSSHPPKRPRSPSVEDEENKSTTEQLRKLSRQSYLQRREAQQLEKLRDEIIDEKTLFSNEKLTKRELDELRLKEDIYKLAVERSNVTKDVFRQSYHMPDANGVNEDEMRRKQNEKNSLFERYSLLNSSSTVTDSTVADVEPKSDGALWELNQIKKGSGQPSELDFQLSHSLPGLHGSSSSSNTNTSKINGISSGQQQVTKRSENKEETEGEKRKKIQDDRKSLPMYSHREEIIAAIKANQILIIQSETGSGKTTQIPQYICEEAMGPIICTQPRRVAAMSVASRVAHEMGCKLGGKVGYSIRFEDCSSEETEIKFVTDGMLLREFLIKPDLKQYKVIMIDEAHERSVNTDVLMGLIKDVIKYRGDDIRVIISSATINTKKFSTYFNNAPIYNIPGKRFDIEIFYTKKPQADYIQACCQTILQIHMSQPRGDILVFLTGQDEIEQTNDLLLEYTNGLGNKMKELIITCIYSTLPSDQQVKIFEETPEHARKVVLATNIAETSITIPGIVYVIDTGFSKQKNYNVKTGVESLLIQPVSKAGARQRAGRAGRIQSGKCFRLYTKWSYDNEMDTDQAPELLRSNINQIVLLLVSLGISNLMDFDFLDRPSTQSLLRSLEHLYALGALSSSGDLTKTGRTMVELPLDPMLSRSLIAAGKLGCTEEIVIISAMLSVNNAIFLRPRVAAKRVLADAKRRSLQSGGGGDHMALLRTYVAWRGANYSAQWCFEHFVEAKSMRRARDIYTQLDQLLDRVGIDKGSCGSLDKISVLKAFTAGFFYNAVRLQKNGHYKTIKNPHTVYIHPSSGLAKAEIRPRWLVFHELVFTTKEYMRQVFDIEGKWLHEAAPHFYKEEDVVDTSNNKLPRAVGKSGSKIR